MVDSEHLHPVTEDEPNACNGNCGPDCSCPGGCSCNREPDDPRGQDATIEIEVVKSADNSDSVDTEEIPTNVIGIGSIFARGDFSASEASRRIHPSSLRLDRSNPIVPLESLPIGVRAEVEQYQKAIANKLRLLKEGKTDEARKYASIIDKLRHRLSLGARRYLGLIKE